MKTIKNLLVILVILLALISCVTQTQVKEIVASSNAAMIVLPQADGGAVDEAKLKAAIDRIEAVIAAHPDQAVLVNTLRVRQAMMLTVANKPKAAEILWSQVTAPPGQRDAALYDLRNEMIWWFGAAKNFKDEDIEKGEIYLGNIDNVCNPLPKRSNIRGYFETMRAAIGFAIANKTITALSDAGKRKMRKKEVANQMVVHMKRYAGQCDEADRMWIVSNWTATETFPDVSVSVLRTRVEVRRLMMEYFKLTRRKNLQEFEAVTWQPEWVQARWQAWKNDN
jgi:hypothetical protein